MDVDGNLDIGIVDAAGGTVERLTDDPEVDIEPAWSPDGDSLYFASRRSGNLDIYRLDLETGTKTLVVGTRRNDFQPAVSPDGTKLAYVSPVSGRSGSGGIWIVPHDPRFPVVCMDETSKQLVREVRPALAPEPGRAERHDYEYQRNGVANLFLAFEPLAGWRCVDVTENRARRDWALFLVSAAFGRAGARALRRDELSSQAEE